MDDLMRVPIFQRLKHILVTDFAKDEALVTPSATLRGTLMMDSLDLVDLVFFLQREFHLEARLEDLRDVKSLDALVTYIARSAGSATSPATTPAAAAG
jgi:acyl carrier protein